MSHSRKGDLTLMAHSLMPFSAGLGLEVLEGSPEKVVGQAHWQPERCTAGGMLHGGYLMSLADSLGALCAALNMPKGATTSTIETKTNFFRAVREGGIEVVATPVHVGRTTIVVQTDIMDGKGRHVSRTLQTQVVRVPGRTE